MISLYIGGARSGKSGLAEQEVSDIALPTTYIATATASVSMAERIALHREQRPDDWVTEEIPLELASALTQIDRKQSVIIIDCLTLWLTNQLMAKHCLIDEIERLCDTFTSMQCHLVLVSTEVGQGLIPDDEMSQQFVTASGLMHQKIAAIADRVSFCQSKLAIRLKEPERTISDTTASDTNASETSASETTAIEGAVTAGGNT
ncbi:bifunctional adenosylcobinamide kinase/adenosylcobinamide-phosphate guanylyltransferase [Shewanella atlantica]|uniref:Bifunctional adenosylcobalamin biosynthesis protein n=1 Tax=Shewanella atlantica TaxID=271099 RepID=A0A431WDH7_9GAMM|nr:bifunctional adenosylcobinamide kinase/adenosylcobinamide-phosphate guanylyltransferase [Shewanella atlantica]RTR33570.1 bifunctional adenosylcobinamide kinase/adenosylcobinamide-phosphate guanylyltransferase [Shewanella atlantica]